MSQAEAYRQAVSDTCTDKTAWEQGARLARKVGARVRELHSAIHGEVNEAFVYRYQEAMAELHVIHRKAFMDGDNSAVVAAIGKKCKISGLEVDPRGNAAKPFEGATDEELDAEIDKAQREVARAAVRH